MKKSLYTFFVPLCIMVLSHNSDLNPTYIKLENVGPTFKSFPVIIFYSAKALDTLKIPYGESFRAEEGELESIEAIIRQNISQSKSDSPEVYYEFTIVKDQEKFVNSTTSISTVKNIFNLISSKINDDKIKKSARNQLDYIMGRLSY